MVWSRPGPFCMFQQNLSPVHYLEGHGDLVSKLIMGIVGGLIWVIGVVNPLT